MTTPKAYFLAASTEPSDTLHAWTRHYARLIGLFLLIGLVGGILYDKARPELFAASTIIAEKGVSIAPRQLGPVAQAVFQSGVVYGPAMRHLGRTESPARFLEQSAKLLPVPDAPLLLVVGRAKDLAEAESISLAMAEALVDALNVHVGEKEFIVFGVPQRTSLTTGVSRPVAIAIGTTTGLWLGLGAALLHYRRKRPVLTFRRALAISGAHHVTMIETRKSRWLRFVPKGAGRNSSRPSPRLLEPLQTTPDGGVLPPGGVKSPSFGAPSDAHAASGNSSSSPLGSVVVAHAGTPEVELHEALAVQADGARPDRDPGVALVWLR